MKEKLLDKATIDAYQDWVQTGIRRDLNSISLGPGKLPCRSGVFLVICAICCLLVGILLVALRMRHVYLWDWDAQFLGPFFFILFLLCMATASYMFITAKRRSNKYRSELYFRPVGDWGVVCIHKSELVLEEEMKHELKSGTNPHTVVKPRSEAYSQSSRGGRRQMQQQTYRSGRDNYGYDRGPQDANRPFRPADRRGGPPPGQRGPQSEGRRGPPLEGRRGPSTGGQLGPPPDRHGPPSDRYGPSSQGRRGPPSGSRFQSQGLQPEDRDQELEDRQRNALRFEGAGTIKDRIHQGVRRIQSVPQDDLDV
ncbi:hypothetical protein BsWGS_06521 [Bradybaena similaris]